MSEVLKLRFLGANFLNQNAVTSSCDTDFADLEKEQSEFLQIIEILEFEACLCYTETKAAAGTDRCLRQFLAYMTKQKQFDG